MDNHIEFHKRDAGSQVNAMQEVRRRGADSDVPAHKKDAFYEKIQSAIDVIAVAGVGDPTLHIQTSYMFYDTWILWRSLTGHLMYIRPNRVSDGYTLLVCSASGAKFLAKIVAEAKGDDVAKDWMRFTDSDIIASDVSIDDLIERLDAMATAYLWVALRS